MPLGMEVGLGRGYIVLDEDPAGSYPHGKGHMQQPPLSKFTDTCFACVRIIRGPCQTAGWIKIPLGSHHIVLDGDQVPHPTKKTKWQHTDTAAPQLSAHVYCGQTAGWIKMPLGTEIGLCWRPSC